MDKQEENKNEILEAIIEFSTKVEERFDKIDGRFTKIESTMVTKDYLDDKLADLRGDLVVLTRKEDIKVRKLIEVLERRQLLNHDEVKEILSMEPFPQLYL